MNLSMKDVPVKKVQGFYESKYQFKSVLNEETGETHMEKNCSFTARYFISDKGGDQATEPSWRTSPSGKEYCLIMGDAKVKGMPQLGDAPQLCILNKKSYDNGDFEIGTLYSAICNIPMLDADGNRHQDFNDIYFTVFENESTNNDMSDILADEWASFVEDEDTEEDNF